MRLKACRLALGLGAGILLFTGFNSPAAAAPLTLPTFSIRPAKVEFWLAPGETATRQISLANHLGRDAVWRISLEELANRPAENPDSLAGFVDFPKTVTVADGQSASIPLTVKLPKKLGPGSRQGLVIFALNPLVVTGSNVTPTSRLGALILVRVNGQARESGQLTDWRLIGSRFHPSQEPLDLILGFSNQGNVYLNPYGEIRITGLFGRVAARRPIDPWFILPASSRSREFNLPAPGAGIYRVTARLNRGYQNLIDEASLWLVVRPKFGYWWFGLGLILAAFLAVVKFKKT